MSVTNKKPSAYRHADNFGRLLHFCADIYGEKTAFSFKCGKEEKKTVSYSALFADVKKTAAFFSRSDLKGKRIALVSENCYEWIVSYFACVCLGGAAVALDKELSAGELSELLKRSRCHAVFYSKGYEEKVKAAAEENGLTQISASEVRQIIESGQESCDLDENIPPGTLASIVFTSGTTGDSKGVMLTHENLLSDAAAAADAVENYQKCLLVLPAHHTFGLVAGILVPMLKGCEVFICSSLRRITRELAFFQPQVLVVVPVIAETMYQKILTAAEAQGKTDKLKKAVRLSSFLLKCGIDIRKRLFRQVTASFGGALEGIVCGGAAVDPDCARGFQSLGIDFLNGYGITECSPIVSVNRKKANRIGSVGQPISCNSIRITEKDNDGIGNIEVKGKNVFGGYLDSDSAGVDDGWFKTGDLGRIDKDGFLYITGRKKNLIILSNGKNVSPEELENSLIHNKYIREIVVYEADGKITAEIFPDTNFSDEETENNINEAVNAFNKTVPAYKNIEKVIIRKSEFPKTAIKKIKRKYDKAEKGESVNV